MADKKKQKTGPMRLDKFLGEMGYGTRTQIKEMVRKGRVQVNGQVIKAPESKLAPETDQVMVDQALVGYARMEYYMLNKPQGVVSATTDSRYPTVVGLIGDALRKDLFPVGRLDVDTEGLLIITNDGEMAHNLLSPKNMWIRYIWPVCPASFPRMQKSGLGKGLSFMRGLKPFLPCWNMRGMETAPRECQKSSSPSGKASSTR